MNAFIPLLLIIPIISLLVGFSFSNKDEKGIYTASISSVLLNFMILVTLIFSFIFNGLQQAVFEGPVLYHSGESEITLNLFIDGFGLAYMFVATVLTGAIIVFSKNYIHREKGYKRFFNNLKFFYLGVLIVLLADNMETLFIGWEVLGVTSFLLIGFYRERYLPVKNALKVVSLYRIADIALLLGIWVSHHYFGHSIRFSNFEGLQNTESHVLNDSFYHFMIPSVFLIAAMVKSAQFPFSSWLPRAMEGPTTSSAIFYGSLSVHIGVFLLIRTAPFWENNSWFHIIIGSVGLITCVTATLTSRVQSSIKTQIAYSSIAQIGLMFIEVSLGLYWFAIFHFACNAFFRSYQLLLSPSVLSYRIHEQLFHFTPPAEQKTNGFWNKFKLSIYVLSIKEFNLDNFMYQYLWSPLKKLGRLLGFIKGKTLLFLMIPIFFIGLYTIYNQDILSMFLLKYLPLFFAGLGFVLILKSFVERDSSLISWLLILMNQLLLSLAFGFNEKFDFNQIHLFLSGIIVAGIIGVWVLVRLKGKDEDISLNEFHGHSYEYPRLAFLFIICCLAVAGFPITPTFIGEDLLLGHIHENQFPLLILVVLNLILDGLVIFRIYSRIFLGKHKKGYHEFAYRSS
jgi:NADH-quinone oxidoreductase subunit L